MIYELGIIGAGVAGCVSALRVQEKYKQKTIIFDIGHAFAKRRRQIEGALGCFPTGDGKLYLSDLEQFSATDGRSLRSVKDWVFNTWKLVGPNKVTKDKLPSNSMQKFLSDNNFTIQLNDFIQWKPESVHNFSKLLVKEFEESQYLTFKFDTIVGKIMKKKGIFHVFTDNGDYQCKNIILATGRSGFRWVTDFAKEIGLTVEDNLCTFGVKFEISKQYVKDLKECFNTWSSQDEQIGPLSWNGTIIPEDHADLVNASFRSNEDRWKSEKLSFNYFKSIEANGDGVSQTERIGKLTYLLFNDRVSKEKIKVYQKKQSQLNILPEYNWLDGVIEKLSEIIPDFKQKANYHVPNILTMPAKIKLKPNFESELEGLYVVGENAKLHGIVGAAISSVIATDAIFKE